MTEKADIRRFGYYIPKPDGTMDISIHKTVADAETLTELNEIVDVIFKLQPIIFAFDIVEKNYAELLKSFSESVSKLNGMEPVNISTSFALDTLISVSQKVTNLLSSTSAFLTHNSRQLHKIYGEGSQEWKIWDEGGKICTRIPSLTDFFTSFETSTTIPTCRFPTCPLRAREQLNTLQWTSKCAL